MSSATRAGMHRGRVRGVVFDLDGTLADTLGGISQSSNRALGEMGLQSFDESDYRLFVGDGMGVLGERVLAAQGLGSDEALLANWMARYRHYYAAAQLSQSSLYPGILQMLNALRGLGLRLAVLSNKPHEYTQDLVMHLCGAALFEVVEGVRPGRPRKPSPDGAFAIAKQLELNADDFLFVGDSGTDMDTARAAAMTPVGVSWGFRDESELCAHGAAVILHEPMQMLDFVSACTKEG